MSSRSVDVIRADPLAPLLVLRAFLGVTFLYAGLSKIWDRSFLDDADISSMHASVVAVKSSSPIGGLLGPVVDHSFAFGLVMALAEVAVGIGTLLGLFHRIAAVGGMVLALSLFLTVSWGADPWYTGADIVYVFAFTPLLLAPATPLSADRWLADVRERHPGRAEDRTRRVVLAGGAAVVALVSVGASSLFRGSRKSDDASGSDPTGSTTSTGSAPSTGAAPSTDSTASAAESIVAASAVPVGGGATGKDPSSGDEIWVLQLNAGDYTAYNATCPHQQCAVTFVSASDGFSCPCHRSAFDSTGAVTRGPATQGLTKVAVTESNGQIVPT